jgi:lipoyl-dependent peroxiredoxin
MKHKRTADIVWQGSGPKGNGTIDTLSGALAGIPYTSDARFVSEDGKAGTNPEELIGAAHASCFTLALAYRVDKAGHTATELRTKSTVTLEKGDSGWSVTNMHLDVTGKIPGIDAAKFTEIAEDAKKNCPISRAIAAPVTLTAKLA